MGKITHSRLHTDSSMMVGAPFPLKAVFLTSSPRRIEEDNWINSLDYRVVDFVSTTQPGSRENRLLRAVVFNLGSQPPVT